MSEESQILEKLNAFEKQFSSFEGHVTEWRNAVEMRMNDMEETLYGKNGTSGLKTASTQHNVYFVLIGACLLSIFTAFAASFFAK